MNAVAPPGLKPDPRRGSADEDSVRLTMDYDDVVDEPGAAPSIGDALPTDASPKGSARAPRASRNPDTQASTEPATANSGHAASHTGSHALVPPQLAAIEVSLSVEIGSRMIPLRDLMELEPGQLFALDRMTNEPVTILVNNKPFAHGEVVAIGERFGVRLLDLLPGGSV